MARAVSEQEGTATTHSLAREFGAAITTVSAIASVLVPVTATGYVFENRKCQYLKPRAIQRDQIRDGRGRHNSFAPSDLARFVSGQLLAAEAA